MRPQTEEVRVTDDLIPHDWARPILLATHPNDIRTGILMLTSGSVVCMAEPFCIACGAAFPSEARCVPAKSLDDAMADALALINSPQVMVPARSARLVKRA